jgi:hypothetical protein
VSSPPPETDAPAVSDRAPRWLGICRRLVDHPLRVAWAKAELEQTPVEELARALDDVCRGGEQMSVAARDVLDALVPVVTDVSQLGRVGAIRVVAQAEHLMSASRFLRCSTPEGHLLSESREGHHGVLQRADGRPLTLGERRALARKPARATLAKLLADPHPMVVRLVLANPRLTEDDVVRMAARRPATVDAAREIVRVWSRAARVRMAILLNPGSPPAVSIPLLYLLTRQELGEVEQAADIPAVVRATARELVELRPPFSTHPSDDGIVRH